MVVGKVNCTDASVFGASRSMEALWPLGCIGVESVQRPQIPRHSESYRVCVESLKVSYSVHGVCRGS